MYSSSDELTFGCDAHLLCCSAVGSSYPHTLTSQYLGTEYLGENALHIAIINEDETTVRELVMRGQKELLTARATGRFFQYGSACYCQTNNNNHT